MSLRLDGKALAGELEQRLQGEISSHQERAGRPPGLAVIRIGDDPASGVYVANKQKACTRIGIRSFGSHLPRDISELEVLREIESLNNNQDVDGILLQLPLPIGFNESLLLKAIDPTKDADGLHALNLGKLIKGEEGPRSCTPAGIMALLRRNNIEVEGKRVVVVGRSILVGKPMALMLEASNATVTVAHSKTQDLFSLTKTADILVVAVGKPEIIGIEHVAKNSVVVDVGIHKRSGLSPSERTKSKLCGDVRFEEVSELVAAITPVPGGVGPMTVAMLLVNTVSRWQKHCGLPFSLVDLLP